MNAKKTNKKNTNKKAAKIINAMIKPAIKKTVKKADVKKPVKKADVKKPVKKAEDKKPIAMAIIDDEGKVTTTEPKAVKKPLTDEEKRAKRNEYARAYYQKNRELLCKRSCEWHKAHPRKAVKGDK